MAASDQLLKNKDLIEAFDFSNEGELKYRVWNFLDCMAMGLDRDKFLYHYDISEADVEKYQNSWKYHQLRSI